MKTFLTIIFVAIILAVFCLIALADGPVFQVSPFMKPVLESQNSAGAQTALGFTGNTTLTVITNAAIGATAPIFQTVSNNVTLNNQLAAAIPAHPAVYIDAQQALNLNPTLTDGSSAAVTNYFGPYPVINNANGSSSVQFTSTGANGNPGFLFPLGGNAQLEVSNCLSGSSSFTIAFSFVDYNGPNNELNYIVQAGGWGLDYPYSYRFTTWEDAPIGSQVTGGSIGYFGFVATGLTSSVGVLPAQRRLNTYIFNFDGVNEWAYLNGALCYDTRLQPSTSSAGLLNNATNLYIGGQITGGENFNGVLQLFGYWTNVLTAAQCSSLANYMKARATAPDNIIGFGGDSVSVGLHTTAVAGAWPQFLGSTFQNHQVQTTGYSGRTLQEEYTNFVEWLATKPAGQRIYGAYIGINNFDTLSGPAQITEVPIALGWMTNIMTLAASNGISFIFPTLASSQSETNSIVTSSYDWRSNYNAVVRSYVPTLGTLWDVAAIPCVGTNGAYANANYVDGLHFSALGYTNTWPSLYPLVYQQIHGTPPIYTNGTVNLPGGQTMLYAGLPVMALQTNAPANQAAIYLGNAGSISNANISIRSVAIGNLAMANATNDNGSVAIGAQAAQNLPGGEYNIAIGWDALQGMNQPVNGDVAIGFESQLANNSDMNGNVTAIGNGSFLTLANGHADTAIGEGAGASLTAGNYDLYLGASQTGLATESGITRIGTPGQTTSTYIIGTIYGTQIDSTNGLASHARGALLFSAGGCTNNAAVNFVLYGVSGVFILTNFTTAWGSTPISESVGQTYILQPGMAIVGSSCSEYTNAPF